MSAEWPEYSLGDLLEITSSKRIFRSDYVEEGVPFFRSKEVIERANGNEISTELFITREKYDEIKNKSGVPIEGDILLTSVGTLGVSYQVEKNDKFYFKDGNLTWFRNFSDKISSRFLLYWLRSPIAKRAFEMITIGSTQKALTIVSLKKVKINLPDIDTQLEIVKVLDSLEGKLNINRQINQTFEQIAQAIFKSWFVDFEPVKAKIEAKQNGQDPERAAMRAISGKTHEELDALSEEQGQQLATTAAIFPDELEDSELGEIPKGWSVEYLKDVTEIAYGKNLPTKELLEEGYPVFGGNGVIGFHSKYLYEEPRVLVACRGAASGKVLRSLPQSFVTNNSLVIDHEKKGYLTSYYLQPALMRYGLVELTSGSAQPQMTIANMNPVQIVIPTKNVIDTHRKLVEPIYKEILGLERQNRSLAAIRDLVLPRLLSSEIEPNNPMVEEA